MTTIEYSLIEKKDLPLLRPGFPLAWVNEGVWDAKGHRSFVEGFLVEYIVRSSNRAWVRRRGHEMEQVNKFRLHRILVPNIEDIAVIYDYDS